MKYLIICLIFNTFLSSYCIPHDNYHYEQNYQSKQNTKEPHADYNTIKYSAFLPVRIEEVPIEVEISTAPDEKLFTPAHPAESAAASDKQNEAHQKSIEREQSSHSAQPQHPQQSAHPQPVYPHPKQPTHSPQPLPSQHPAQSHYPQNPPQASNQPQTWQSTQSPHPTQPTHPSQSLQPPQSSHQPQYPQHPPQIENQGHQQNNIQKQHPSSSSPPCDQHDEEKTLKEFLEFQKQYRLQKQLEYEKKQQHNYQTYNQQQHNKQPYFPPQTSYHQNTKQEETYRQHNYHSYNQQPSSRPQTSYHQNTKQEDSYQQHNYHSYNQPPSSNPQTSYHQNNKQEDTHQQHNYQTYNQQQHNKQQSSPSQSNYHQNNKQEDTYQQHNYQSYNQQPYYPQQSSYHQNNKQEHNYQQHNPQQYHPNQQPGSHQHETIHEKGYVQYSYLPPQPATQTMKESDHFMGLQLPSQQPPQQFHPAQGHFSEVTHLAKYSKPSPATVYFVFLEKPEPAPVHEFTDHIRPELPARLRLPVVTGSNTNTKMPADLVANESENDPNEETVAFVYPVQSTSIPRKDLKVIALPADQKNHTHPPVSVEYFARIYPTMSLLDEQRFENSTRHPMRN